MILFYYYSIDNLCAIAGYSAILAGILPFRNENALMSEH